ncbi:hypothetical protein [Saccharothrix australiensis]|uniref:hypothetical protein n=1 Tax=Saccharothrix australiensis TaxID=2072 RepID=UPI001B87DCEB|nr:hypothetical protein [Saccharothrix australiensis]
MNYADIDTLSSVYLEDSFVLEILEPSGEPSFRGEFVLTENHPRYSTPASGEQYCYADGMLTFPNVTRVEWVRRSTRHFTDAAGEEDLGNIDYLDRVDDYWLIGGDWGEARVFTEGAPRLVLA